MQFRAPSIEWDMVQSILSRYKSSLADYLIEVAEEGANLGAFKQVWRKLNKKGLLPSYKEAAKVPLNNIKTHGENGDFILTGAQILREKRERELVSYIKA